MRNINSKNINDANASSRGFSSAPWNNYSNTSFNSKEMAQSGRSMIEMLGVLAIIGVLSVGGIAGYSKAIQKYRINKTIEQISLIAGNVRAFFAPQRSYTGLHCGYCIWTYDTPFSCSYPDSCDIVKKAKLIPDEMLTLENGKITAITNAFGGVLELEGVDSYFTITIDQLSEEACIELGSYDWRSAQATAINFDGEDKYWLPIEMEDVINGCSYNYGNKFISIAFDLTSAYCSEQDLVDCAGW